MQSTKVKERTRGRQEGREGTEEGGIVASGDPALQECADGHVPQRQGGGERCILGNSAEVTPPVLGHDQIARNKGIDFVSHCWPFSEAQQPRPCASGSHSLQAGGPGPPSHGCSGDLFRCELNSVHKLPHRLGGKVIGKPEQIVYL